MTYYVISLYNSNECSRNEVYVYILLWRCSSAIFPCANPSPVLYTPLIPLTEEVILYVLFYVRPSIRPSSPPTQCTPLCLVHRSFILFAISRYIVLYNSNNNNLFNIPSKTFLRYLKISVINCFLRQSSSFLINRVINIRIAYIAGYSVSRLPPHPTPSPPQQPPPPPQNENVHIRYYI
jgi:hypothetical protein